MMGLLRPNNSTLGVYNEHSSIDPSAKMLVKKGHVQFLIPLLSNDRGIVCRDLDKAKIALGLMCFLRYADKIRGALLKHKQANNQICVER